MQPAGMSPRQGTSFLCCAKERRQRKAPNASLGLRPSGQAGIAHRGQRARIVVCSVSEANRRPGIPAGLGTENPKSQAARTDPSSLFVAARPCQFSLVSRVGTPARLALPVFAQIHTGWSKDERCNASPAGPRPPEALSAFLWFLSLAQQRKEPACRGGIPAGSLERLHITCNRKDQEHVREVIGIARCSRKLSFLPAADGPVAFERF